MRLKSVTIQNVKGVPLQEFRAGSLTVLSGGNGQGKSSILDALKAVFEGGHDPSLIRLGEKKAEITLVLDDGTTIRKTITDKASKLEITNKDGVAVPKPQAFVESLAAGFAFNPLGLMMADAKERAAFLLEAMPIEFTGTELAAAGVPGIESATLDGLAVIRDGIYESRKVLNKAVRDAEGTINTLQAALPEEDGKDWRQICTDLEGELADVERQIADAEKVAATMRADGEAAVNKNIDEQIAALNAERATRLSTVRDQHDQKLKQINDVAGPERQRIAAARATASEKAQAQTKAAGARESIEKMRGKVRENYVESERLTKVIASLDELRKKKLDALPVEGLEIRDGDVLVDGVPFDQINTADRFILCFKLAKLKLGKLGLMVADQAECLDPEIWPMFCDAAKESGLQVIAARVSDGALRVEAS